MPQKDRHFFIKKEGVTLGDLNAHLQTKAAHSCVEDFPIGDVCSIHEMEDFCLSFVKSQSYLPLTVSWEKAVFLVPEAFKEDLPPTGNFLLSHDVDKDFTRAVQYLYPKPFVKAPHPSDPLISPTARIGKNVIIGSGAVVATGATIGDNTVIGSNVVIGPHVIIGADCEIHAGAVIQCAFIGSSVVVHQNAAIGQAGFGFTVTSQGFLDTPQIGRVIIEDDVHIGACTTIDRGGLRDTIIGAHTRIDNLVQIGHNVRIGRGCVLVSQVGIAGSTEIGDHTMLGGQVGIADNLKIGKGVKIASKSGVMRDIEDGAVVAGIPCVPIKKWHAINILREESPTWPGKVWRQVFQSLKDLPSIVNQMK